MIESGERERKRECLATAYKRFCAQIPSRMTVGAGV